ncbi:hypothetical protein HY480_00685 [Candidatus Uhrbacteria bacterium]|nr:hypothetical protein [Candidatus Uhrbacteria bacterium]
MRTWTATLFVFVCSFTGNPVVQAQDAVPGVSASAEACIDTGPLAEASAVRIRGRIVGVFSQMPCPEGKPRVRFLTPIEHDNGILRLEVSLDDFYVVQAKGLDELQLFNDAASFINSTLGRMPVQTDTKASAGAVESSGSGSGPGPAPRAPRPQLGIRPLTCSPDDSGLVLSCRALKHIELTPWRTFYLPGTFAGVGAWGTLEMLPLKFEFTGSSVPALLEDGRRIPVTELKLSESIATLLHGSQLTVNRWYPAHLRAIDRETTDHRNFYFEAKIVAQK